MKALITGSQGQDGRFLSAYLKLLGYEVVGIDRRPGAKYQGELIAPATASLLIHEAPDEIYHLADANNVWDQNKQSYLDALTIFRTVAHAAITMESKLFFPASSEVFGEPPYSPQMIDTPFNPRNWYGEAKAECHRRIGQLRKDGLYAVSAICYNHTSWLQSPRFVVPALINRIITYKKNPHNLAMAVGNMEASRDIGFAGDFVQAFHWMMQQPKPQDEILATGRIVPIQLIFKAVCALLEYEPETFISDDLYREAEEINFCGKSRYKMKTPIEEVISKMVWYASLLE